MKPRLESAFKKGLIDVASTTNAWIITGSHCCPGANSRTRHTGCVKGGMATGVMKLVGDAIEEFYSTGLAMSHKMIVSPSLLLPRH